MALDSVRQRDARRQVREGEVRPRWASRDAVSSGGVMLAWGGSALDEPRVIFNHEESLPRRVVRVFLVERGSF